VIQVQCDKLGNIDFDDLTTKVTQYQQQIAAIMLTYPSTHGVYEDRITDICKLMHGVGAQVYIDGANLNALVGIAAPGQFGGDVSHLNLHKTFCIPHGGGGPGVGPVAVAEHLKDFLPTHPFDEKQNPNSETIAAAPWGSAGILPISWMYITMMGAAGLRRATEIAVLNANYIAKQLQQHFPVLYKGKNGLVAHECIIDLRPLTKANGISEEDVAKRLMDYGFHSPTMSFPVAGTLMIEPTESESKAEMDRFIDAMFSIREEIEAVIQAKYSLQDNPLVNAPHTLTDVLSANWSHCYSREVAATPLPYLKQYKYWPPVNRVDGAYGDRYFCCSWGDMNGVETVTNE
jgi:glycine dehydrogenase